MRLFLKIIGGLFVALVLVIGVLALSLEAKLPKAPIDVVAGTTGRSADDESSILIFGATRNTGLIVAELLQARGDRVTAFVRPTSNTAALQALGTELIVGDAMDIETVRAAMSAGHFRSVLTTIGCLSCEPPPDYQANANIIKAAVEADIRRLVLITSIGAGDSYDVIPSLSKRFLEKTLPMKTRAEDELRASGLDYTIIRPGGLRSSRGTGNGVLTEENDVFGFIFREDLAALIVAALDDDRTIGLTLAALDAKRKWPWSGE
ncbi:MAG: SDR family oxidoreductase [Gammaproteobacteria bacterium]|nr:MAG: SDR family oxidoreductase [Gammaproteobacteria bacterium]